MASTIRFVQKWHAKKQQNCKQYLNPLFYGVLISTIVYSFKFRKKMCSRDLSFLVFPLYATAVFFNFMRAVSVYVIKMKPLFRMTLYCRYRFFITQYCNTRVKTPARFYRLINRPEQIWHCHNVVHFSTKFWLFTFWLLPCYTLCSIYFAHSWSIVFKTATRLALRT